MLPRASPKPAESAWAVQEIFMRWFDAGVRLARTGGVDTTELRLGLTSRRPRSSR
jgi:hypothetical protein